MTTKITSIEFYVLQADEEKRPHWVSLFKVPSANELLVRMKTSDGVEGAKLLEALAPVWLEEPVHIADGLLTLNEDPGIGLTLSEAAVKNFGSRIASCSS